MAVNNVVVTVHHDEIRDLVRSHEVRDLLRDVARPVEHVAQALAPKRTGYAAKTIHTEMDLVGGEDWEASVSWTWPDAYYLYWHETGSRQLPPRPFLVPALRAAS